MKLRRLLAFAVVFGMLGTVGFGESKRRTEKFVIGPFAETGVSVGQCDGFEVWSDWVALFTEVALWDKDGNWVQSITHCKVLGESPYYNSTGSGRAVASAVAGGPGEIEDGRYDAASGVVSVHGLSWKVIVPGYGFIWGETGNLVQQCDPYTFENCTIVTNVGHSQFIDQDLAALCDYLK